jgi:hypothetical protein
MFYCRTDRYHTFSYTKFGPFLWQNHLKLCRVEAVRLHKEAFREHVWGWEWVLAERLERGGRCRLLKLLGDSKSKNEMSPSLVCLLGLSCRYKSFLSCLGCSSRHSTKYFFPHRSLFQIICPHRPACWASSRAGSPVSYYMSLVTRV